MKRVCLFVYALLSLTAAATAQYAPQAGLAGTTAISATSSQFVGWATGCTVQRGYMNIADPSLGYASAGDSSFATGVPDAYIVSLGDSGTAVLTFAHPIIDGPGADFAVFENGFINTADPSQAFLELAFVEVSSDGVNFFRFPATSLTPVDIQIGNGNYIDASKLNNLAGKYIGMYGTPFDLSELAGTAGLDVNHVTHVRLVDVVGSIGGHASRDHNGNVINEPYPTPFASCGFDLDAVGVINADHVGLSSIPAAVSVKVYPNPATDRITVSLKSPGVSATLSTITGTVLQEMSLTQTINTIAIEQYPAGMYYLVLRDNNGNKWVQVVTKR
jgi:Secretion system C-terminal sorting domain